MADDKNDERPTHSDPDKEAIDEPTTSGTQEADEAAWMMKEGVMIGLFAIAAMVVLALGLMQGTGLIDLFAPIADSGLWQWIGLGVLVVLVLAAFAWTRVGV